MLKRKRRSSQSCGAARCYARAGAYVIGAWLALQAAEVLVGLDILPDTIGKPLLIVLLAGFPLALLLS